MTNPAMRDMGNSKHLDVLAVGKAFKGTPVMSDMDCISQPFADIPPSSLTKSGMPPSAAKA